MEKNVFIPTGNARFGEIDYQIQSNAMAKKVDVVMDQSEAVQNSITGLKIAGILGAVLAAAIVFAFLRSLWGTVVIVLAMPISLLCAFIGLYLNGETLNSMTLGGLILAIGILVDQAIVVLDNISRHIRMGEKPLEAATIGTQEVVGPVFISTMTFIVVFLPVVFLSGIAQFLFKPLAIAAIMTVGMVVEYNVIMIEFANRLQEQGHTRREAIVAAAQIRLVPILMTSLTTALALLPMALNIGNLGGANQPLALTMLGGTIGAFVLSLIVTPALYAVFASK